jgi:Uncharacterised nucleotidyltransferase
MIEVSNSEQQVLIACVRASLASRLGGEDDFDLVEVLDGVEDWSALVQTAMEHSMFGLLWYCSTLAESSGFPVDIKYALDRFSESQRAENIRMAEKLFEVLDALAGEGIKAAPFKGPLLAESAYNDIGLRTFWDLDFLVPEAEFDRSLAVLEQHGFYNVGQPVDGYSFSNKQLSALWRYWCQAVYYRDEDELSLEPHLGFAPATLALDYDLEALWQRARQEDWRGRKTWRFEPEDELLILCLQGAKPYWDNLKLPADLAHFIVNHPELEWGTVIERARDYGLLRMLALAILLVERLYGLAVPELPGRLAQADPLAAKLCETLLHQGDAEFAYGSTDVFRISRYHLDIRERTRDKLRYIWRTLTRPREQYLEIIRLPDALFWGYGLLKVGSDAFVLARAQLRRLLAWVSK